MRRPTGPGIPNAAQLASLGLLPSAGEYVVSPGNPGAYQTIQAALTAGTADALAGRLVVVVASGRTYTENLVVPPGIVDLVSYGTNQYGTIIDGTLTWDGAAGNVLTLTKLEVNGAVSGTASGTCSFILNQVNIDSTITFAGSAVHIYSAGGSGTGFRGFCTGAVSTTGLVSLMETSVSDAITCATRLVLESCSVSGTAALTCSGTTMRFLDTLFTGARSFVFSGSAGTATVDEFSLTQILAAGGSAPTNGVWGKRTILPAGLTLTIASGAITVTNSVHAIAGEGAANDDLVTINGTVAGQILVLSASDDAVTITAKDTGGNLKLAGDFAMNNLEDRLTLISDGTNLYEIARSDNGA